jgi:hypothetical protein
MTPARALHRVGWAVLASLGLGCGLPFECPGSLETVLEEHAGQSVSLRDVTAFDWEGAILLRPGASAKGIRDATGLNYRPFLDRVPEGRILIAFKRGKTRYCLASIKTFRFGIDLGKDGWVQENPSFQVTAKSRWPRRPNPPVRAPTVGLDSLCSTGGKRRASDRDGIGGGSFGEDQKLGGLMLGSPLCDDPL